jgi:hypothetical protein
MELSSRPLLHLTSDGTLNRTIMTNNSVAFETKQPRFGLTTVTCGLFDQTETVYCRNKQNYTWSVLMNDCFCGNKSFCIPMWPLSPVPALFLPDIFVIPSVGFTLFMALSDSVVLPTKFTMVTVSYKVWKCQTLSVSDTMLNSFSLSLVSTLPLSLAALVELNTVSDLNFALPEMIDDLCVSEFIEDSLCVSSVAVDQSFIQPVSRYKTEQNQFLPPTLQSVFYYAEKRPFLSNFFSDLLNYSCSGKGEQLSELSEFENSYVESSFGKESDARKIGKNVDLIPLSLELCNFPHHSHRYSVFGVREAQDAFSMLPCNNNYMPFRMVRSFGIKTIWWTLFQTFLPSSHSLTTAYLFKVTFNCCCDWTSQKSEKGEILFVKEILSVLMRASFSVEEAVTKWEKKTSTNSTHHVKNTEKSAFLVRSYFPCVEATPHNDASLFGMFVAFFFFIFTCWLDVSHDGERFFFSSSSKRANRVLRSVFSVLSSEGFLEENANVISSLFSDFDISCSDLSILNHVDLIVDPGVAIVVVEENQLHHKDQLKAILQNFLHASFQFSSIWLLISSDNTFCTNDSRLTVTQSVARVQVKTIMRDCANRPKAISKLVSGIYRSQCVLGERKLLKSEGYKQRSFILKLNESSHFHAQCHFLQQLLGMNVLLAASLLNKVSIKDLFTANISRISDLCSFSSPRADEMGNQLENFIYVVNEFL